MSKPIINLNDAQSLAFVQGQAYEVNSRVYETMYPDWDFGRLIYVETTGNPWSPGILTYTSDFSGKANWQSGYAKDVPMADISQDMQMRTYQMAAIGYQWNIEEINTALNFGGALPDRRARAARQAYTKFMYDLTLSGSTEKGMGGLINYANVATVPAQAGEGGATYWVDKDGKGQKTAAEIVRDINNALQGVNLATNDLALADTILLPQEAYNFIASTPYSAMTTETILSFVQRANIYTVQTGQPLTIRVVRELSKASTAGTEGTGRLVAYKNDQDFVKLHLPMPHQFLPVYQDGPFNYAVPGIFRTGGVEFLTTLAVRYVDSISQPPVDGSTGGGSEGGTGGGTEGGGTGTRSAPLTDSQKTSK